MGRHSRPVSPDGESDDSFARELAEIQAMQNSEDEPQVLGHSRELGDWLLNYIRAVHPAVYTEAMRERGTEVARRNSRKMQPGVVVTDDHNGNRWRVTSRFTEGHREMAAVEDPDGVTGKFWITDLAVDSDQSWPLDLSIGSDSSRPYSAQS